MSRHKTQRRRPRTSKEQRRIMQTYHRKDDIPDCDAEVKEEHAEPKSGSDEEFLEEYVNRRKRKVRRICVSPCTSAESLVVTAVSIAGNGEITTSHSHNRMPTSNCHCNVGAVAAPYETTGHDMYGALAQPMRPTAAAAAGMDQHGEEPGSEDSYSMFGDRRNYDNETLTRWSSSLFNWVYAVFGAVLGLGEHVVKTPFLLGLTLATIFLVIIASQIEIMISYLIE
ncbi:hypothetical protein PFISCL1PPCAC_11244, partial [Pristionchus fissidentatus]